MKFFAAVNSTTGAIIGIQGVSNPNLYTDGQIKDGNLLKELPVDHREVDYIRLKYWDGSAWQDYPEKPDDYHNWNGSAWIFDSDQALFEVRRQRTSLLWGTDWTQISDSPLSDEDKAAWITYRQNLRDITNGWDSITCWSDVTWPTAP